MKDIHTANGPGGAVLVITHGKILRAGAQAEEIAQRLAQAYRE